MNHLLQSSIRRAGLIITLTIIVLVWGAISAFQMQRDYLPEINNPTLTITVKAQSLQADQVKEYITKPIQEAVRVVDNLQDVETNSFNGGSFISLNFPMKYDMEKAEQQVNKAIEEISLPKGSDKPLVNRLSTHSLPIMTISLKSNNVNITENMLRTSVQEEVVKGLKTVPGIKDIQVSGGGNAGYAISIRKDDLIKSGFSVDDINNSLKQQHTTETEGDLSDGQMTVPIKVNGWGLNKTDLQKLSISREDGKTVSLSDVADISNSIVNLQTISRTKGTPSVVLDILKTPSSNISNLSKSIHSRLQDITPIKNNDVEASILFDQGQQVNHSLQGLVKEGLLGCLFSMICVFLFFHNVRSTLLIAISLPICLLATTGILKLLGISLNILTVSGLVVAMGRVVDDSIVILDNINRKVKEGKELKSFSFITLAVKEMIPAIVSSTATTVAVYIPIALVGGLVGAAFSGFAWSVVIALIISLVVSVLVVPALYNLVWKGKPTAHDDFMAKRSYKIYGWVFQRRKLLSTITVSLFVVLGVASALLPVNILTMTNNTGQLGIQIELPKNTSLSEVDEEVKRVEGLLQKNPNVSSFSSGLGSSFTPQSDDVFDAGGGWIQQPNIANLSLSIRKNADKTRMSSQLQKQLDTIKSSAIYTVTDKSISGDDSLLKINLIGADSQTLENLSRSVGNRLKLIPGLAVQGLADEEGTASQYQLTLNRKMIEQNGLNLSDIINRFKLYTAEGTIGEISINNNTYPIVLHLKNVDSKNAKAPNETDPALRLLNRMGNESFINKEGRTFRLNQLVVAAPITDASVIQEKDGHPYAVITGNILSRDIGKVTKQVKSVLKNTPLPEGVNYSFAGAPEQVKEMIYEMAIALSFSILIVLSIISCVFRGWKAPLTVLVCIPLAFIGSVAGMLIFQLEWNLAALVGLLMLTGIVVTNGIVLVDKIERNRLAGHSLDEALLQGTLSRIRPILTTALTTILTLMPLALSSQTDTIISQTLGIVVIGGLVSSTLISLFMIPILYKWLHKNYDQSSNDIVDDLSHKYKKTV
ncbi:efflux RND transporter permease subunit [Bacillus sp. AFS053548]|uniref:efflux RND transporter permease subunit n=1 Tax=Bacillus sp. AFS053548 TaxID=2033505 RepID=UPI000BFBB816|nr:efflux RND transporter permease subunit [Bacillus sp. AFS053548]PGM58203.1 acriflavine resistance protein B [Bacillus sp. AFS053548]